MYNRYIPQSDGSYRRRCVQEQQSHPNPSPPPKPSQPVTPCPPIQNTPPRKPPHRMHPQPSVPAKSFLRQLLPQDLDTGDLMVILLLLLMAGDCQEDKSTAWLTLAMYLFM